MRTQCFRLLIFPCLCKFADLAHESPVCGNALARQSCVLRRAQSYAAGPLDPRTVADTATARHPTVPCPDRGGPQSEVHPPRPRATPVPLALLCRGDPCHATDRKRSADATACG